MHLPVFLLDKQIWSLVHVLCITDYEIETDGAIQIAQEQNRQNCGAKFVALRTASFSR